MKVTNIATAAIRNLAATSLTAAHLIATMAIAAMVLFATASADEITSDDQVVASFERAFNRGPSARVQVTRSVIDEDLLYEMVNSIHWPAEEEKTHLYSGSSNLDQSQPCFAAQVTISSPVSGNTGK